MVGSKSRKYGVYFSFLQSNYQMLTLMAWRLFQNTSTLSITKLQQCYPHTLSL